MKNNFGRVMNVIFYILTFLCVLFTVGSICSANEDGILTARTFFGILFGAFYLFTYYCHKEISEYVLKKYYVEKEDFNTLLKEITTKKETK